MGDDAEELARPGGELHGARIGSSSGGDFSGYSEPEEVGEDSMA